MAYLDTPHTDAGNQTYLSDAHNLKVDNSFLSPLKRKDSLFLQMRKSHGLPIRTPRAGQPSLNRRNALQAQAEFTPLLKSAVKGNRLKKTRVTNGSEYDGEGPNSSALLANDVSSIPWGPSSSVQSTPIVIPSKDANGIFIEQGNKFTLKEQENMLDKIEKENFGLKMKIHFFEKMLQSADSGYDEAAIKENMDLKIDKVSLQRELARTRKTLVAAEREIDTFRLQIRQDQENNKQRLFEGNLHEELERLKHKHEALEKEKERLRTDFGSAEERRHATRKLEEDIENLEAEGRERDRMLDSKEDETDDLKEQISQHLSNIADLEDDLDNTKQRLREMEEVQNSSEDRIAAASRRSEAALKEKREAENALQDLRAQVTDKSSNAKDLNRKSENRMRHLQKEVDEKTKINSELQQANSQQSQQIEALEVEMKELRQQVETNDQNIRNISLLKRERELALETQGVLETQLRNALEDREKQSEARDLLHDHHKAVRSDLQKLQQEIAKYQTWLADAEKDVEQRQRLLIDNQASSKKLEEELRSVKSELRELGKELQSAKKNVLVSRDSWEIERQDLELERNRFQKRADGLQDMVDKLQASRGATSGQESRLQEALTIEHQRFRDEKSALSIHIKQLQEELNEKSLAIANVQSELANAYEKLNTSDQDRALYEEKAQGLEDEIEVLQCSIEECNEARKDLQAILNNARTEREFDAAFKISTARLQDELESVRLEKASLATRLTQAQDQFDTSNKIHDSEKQSSANSELELRAEVIKLQRKILEAGEDMARIRAESRKHEVACERELETHVATSQKKFEQYKQQQKQLDLDLSEAHRELGRTTSENEACEESCERLRIQLQGLERSVSRAQASNLDEITTAEERKDLHELLRKAKLEAEDLQTQLQEREADLQQTVFEGKTLRNQLSRVQTDQARQKHQINALTSELETQQRRHEVSIESLVKKQREWEAERKALTSRVGFPNTSVNKIPAAEKSLLQLIQAEKGEAEKRHAAEIRGLAKQIQWMKARHSREEGFRIGLIFEKRFLLLQVEMFNACNALDLRILEGMGVASEKKGTATRPTLKAVATAISAALRMQRMQRYWAGQRKIQASLAKKVVQMRHLKMVSD